MGEQEEPQREVPFPDLRVGTDNRVNLDAARRSKYGIEEDEEHDIRFETEGGEESLIPDAKVGSGGRVTIPSNKRDRYDIGPGDYLDVYVTV